jgi:hypothetical protein
MDGIRASVLSMAGSYVEGRKNCHVHRMDVDIPAGWATAGGGGGEGGVLDPDGE